MSTIKNKLPEILLQILFVTSFGFAILFSALIFGAVALFFHRLVPGLTLWTLQSLIFIANVVLIYFCFTPIVVIFAYILSRCFNTLLPESANIPSEGRDAVRAAIAELYIDSQTEAEVSEQTLAFAMSKYGFNEIQVREIAETEVGPVLVPMILINAWAMEDAIETSPESNWLSRKAEKNSKGFRLVRRIPILGYFWARSITKPIRKPLNSAIHYSRVSETSA